MKTCDNCNSAIKSIFFKHTGKKEVCPQCQTVREDNEYEEVKANQQIKEELNKLFNFINDFEQYLSQKDVDKLKEVYHNLNKNVG